MAFLAVAELAHISGLPKDKVVNTFAIAGGNAGDPLSIAGVTDAVAKFYATGVPNNATNAGQYLSKEISRAASAHVVKLYDITNDLAGTPHGSPVGLQTFSIGNADAGTTLPGEVALAVTLEALGRDDAAVEGAAGATRPKQRRTGRFYFGPLNATAVAAGDTARPSPFLIDHLEEAVVRLNTDLIALSAGEALGVWSRADATVRALESFSIDNAFDTQRRRGVAATTRARTLV